MVRQLHAEAQETNFSTTDVPNRAANAAVIKTKKMLKTLALLLIFSLSFIEIPRRVLPRKTSDRVDPPVLLWPRTKPDHRKYPAVPSCSFT